MSDELYEMTDDESASAKKKSSSAASAPSVLDQLKETLAKKIERPEVFIEVPEREGVTVRVSPNVTQGQMRAWRKQAGEDSKNGMDATKFGLLVWLVTLALVLLLVAKLLKMSRVVLIRSVLP